MLALVLACAAFAPALVGGFAYDDGEAIHLNPIVQGQLPALQAFAQDYWHHISDAGHYRPLATLSLRWDRFLWADNPMGFHATSLALHLIVVLLGGLLLHRLLPKSPACFLGLIFFACHPALGDSVAWISGRTSSLCALGGLLGSLWLLGKPGSSPSQQRVLWGAALAPFLACLGKEDGVLFAPLAVFLGLWCGRGRAAWVGALLGIAGAAALRAWALGAPMPKAHGAPLGHLSLLERVPQGALAWLGGLKLVALPWQISPGQEALDRASMSPWIGVLVLLAGLALGIFALTIRKRSSLLAGSLLLVLVSILPTLEIVPAGEVFAPRYLYLPLLFAAPLSGALLYRIPRAFLLALLLVWIPLGWQASQPYTSRAAYWTTRMEYGEETSMGWNALGNARLEAKDPTGARGAFDRAIELDPHYSRPWVNLGTLTWSEDGPAAARPILERACLEGPQNPVAHGNLGAVLLSLGEPIEAEGHYLQAIELAPGRGALWRGLARALLDQGRPKEARLALEKGIQQMGQDPASERLRLKIQEDELSPP